MTTTPPAPPQVAERSFLDRVRRAAMTLLHDQHDEPCGGERREPQLTSGLHEAVAPLTDLEILASLIRQRLALRWRDTTHMELMCTAQALQVKAVTHIDARMSQLTVIRKWIAEPADSVLRSWLFGEVMQPFEMCWKRERAKLSGIQATAVRLRSSDFIFETSVTWLGQEWFRPGNRDLLVQKLQEWMLGPQGLASHYCRQASQMADALMQPKAPC